MEHDEHLPKEAGDLTTMSTVHKIRTEKARNPEREAALRRLALQIAVQLPESPDEAVRVLDYAKTIVGLFLGDSKPV